MTGITEWTEQDAVLASHEGWNVFHSPDSLSGPWTIQKVDEVPTFRTDHEAWEFVWRGAERGLLLCVRALLYIKTNNPAEYSRIRRAVGAEDD